MRRILAVDPGSAKCGIAVVEGGAESSSILYRSVVVTDALIEALRSADADFKPDLVVVGNGTRSTQTQTTIREALPGKSLLVMDEQDTTIRARERYWVETPRRGWRRFLPSSMQVPPVPIDDFVAVILAERVLSVDG